MTLPPISIDTSDNNSQNDIQTRVRSSKSQESCRSESQTSSHTSGVEICRICHCEGDSECGLIAPCYCSGSLRYVHQTCLQQWIKSSNIRSCELCKFQFIMQTKTKPFLEWEPLEMTGFERRKLFCAVMFHAIALTCVVWSLYVLIHRTAEEIQYGLLEWPFWTKLIVVAIGFTGGVVFMYIQCKAYMQICQRWKAFNRVIYVQNAPEKHLISTISSPVGATGTSQPNNGGGTTSQQKSGDASAGTGGGSGGVTTLSAGGGKAKPHPDTTNNTNYKDETSIDLKGVRNLHIFFNDESSLRVQNDQFCCVDEGDASLEGVTVAPSGVVQRTDEGSSTSWHIKIGKGSGSDSSAVVQQRSGENEAKASSPDSTDLTRHAKGDELAPSKNADGGTTGSGVTSKNDSVLKLQIKKAEIVIKFGQKNNTNGEPSSDESLVGDRKDTSVNIKIDDKENDPIVIDVVKKTQQTEKDPVQIRFDFSQNDADEASSTLIQSTYSENSTSETESCSHSPLLAVKPYVSSEK